jgi:hypothetical protein
MNNDSNAQGGLTGVQVEEQAKRMGTISKELKGAPLWKTVAFQVIVYAHENERDLIESLSSIDEAINNFNKECRWILQFGYADCEDNTLLNLAKYAEVSSADKIHLYDFDYKENRGINENNLIKEAHRYKDNYPGILFMEPGGKMTIERPMMVYTAAAYNSPFVVGAWFDKVTGDMTTSWDCADNNRFGPWATLFHISLLPKDGKLFYENINKGRDVLAWDQLKYIEKVAPKPHIREMDAVHHYNHSDEQYKTHGSELQFKQQDNNLEEELVGIEDLLNEDDWEKESKLFLSIKEKLTSGVDVPKQME